MSLMEIVVITICWIAVCFFAWALVRVGDLADKRTKDVSPQEVLVQSKG